MNVSRISLSISPRPGKKVLKKSKFYKPKLVPKLTLSSTPAQNSHSYPQVSKNNIKDIVEIKKKFPNLLTRKIEEV